MRCKTIEISFFSLLIIHIISILVNIDLLFKMTLLTIGVLSIYAYLKVTKFDKKYALDYNFNSIFLLVFCLMYITDILHAFTHENEVNLLKFYANILSYFLLIFLVLRQIKNRGFQKTDFIIKISLIITLSLFCYIFYYLNEMIKTTEMDFYNLFLFYGFTLIILCFLVVINFTQKPNRSNINLCVATICIILNDVFYIINLTYIKIPLFLIIINASNILTYYFLFHYEMNNNKVKEITP